MKFFSQTFQYDDPWSIVSLAFFLRYPNPYAAHVISCDVISRDFSSTGTLVTKRLILKRGAFPRWFPNGIMQRAESWVIEESEVDLEGRVVRCRSRNLDNVKILRVVESITLKENAHGQTVQTTKAEIISRFGWGLKSTIENHGLSKFKANIERSRKGVSLVLERIREARFGAPFALPLGATPMGPASFSTHSISTRNMEGIDSKDEREAPRESTVRRVLSWLRGNSSGGNE